MVHRGAKLDKDFGEKTLDPGQSDQSESQDFGWECQTKTLHLSLDKEGNQPEEEAPTERRVERRVTGKHSQSLDQTIPETSMPVDFPVT